MPHDAVCNLDTFALVLGKHWAQDTVSISDRKALLFDRMGVLSRLHMTERSESAEEIICGPWVSNQWGISSRITHI